MQPSAPRITLSVGYRSGRTGRIVSLLVLGAILTVGCGCVGAFIGTGLNAAAGNNTSGSTAVPALVALLSAGLVMLLIGLLVTSVVRAGAWLEGTRLTVVRLASKTVDLRAARSVSLRATAIAQTGVSSDGGLVATGAVTRTPVLTVSTDTGTVKLGLRSKESLLIPPPEMYALAAALDTARCPGAAEAAGWLRAMAADPRTMLL
ncbi:hypothetical protein GA0070216_101425 [Micromonospora matsumotoense]|uniref:Uncharacterized protein n=1 Tax=Micromonospora matsumotoense TaxID=121616 RepID=A0A1C4UDK4_9ACTN|nr:hypothetical protein [Micromonospora matsumotoense]SCE69756.1 hypothetical protein GA0070216_101425 [Micromonospora matsumotoense]